MGGEHTARAFSRNVWSTSRLVRFIPGERDHGPHWIAGWVGPYTPVWTLWRREKSLSPFGNRNPAAQPVTIPAELCRIVLSIYINQIYIHCFERP
jgi:hypothetical protein